MIKLSRKQKEEIFMSILDGEIYDICPICGIICKTEGAYSSHVMKHDSVQVSKVYLKMHMNLLKAFSE